MKKTGLRLLSLLMGVLLIVGIVVAWVDVFCFDRAFYDAEYQKLGTARQIGMSEEDLGQATQALLDYLRGGRDDLVVRATVNGEEREVFDARETAHMVDVRDLYRGARLVGYISLAAGALYFAALLVFGRNRRPVLRGYIHANWLFLAVVAAIGLFVLIDFNTFWTGFHHVFFRNDLWLLDPRTEILIMMVPSQFFFDLVLRIVIFSLASLALLLAAALIWNRRLKRQESHGI